MKYDKTYSCIGASNHSSKKRNERDFYSTDPRAVLNLINNVNLKGKIWEPCCGNGCISIPLIKNGYNVYSSDLYNNNYGDYSIDFFEQTEMKYNCKNIITNPPYKLATDFIVKGLELLPKNGVLACFLKTQYLEGKERYNKIYKVQPPKLILQYVSRVCCKENGKIEDNFDIPSAIAYSWFVWEKGHKGDTIIKWVELDKKTIKDGKCI